MKSTRNDARSAQQAMSTNEGRLDRLRLAGEVCDPSDVSAGVHELFERQVSATPECPAVVENNACITYRDLDQQANRLARYMMASGVSVGDLVAICLDRSFDMVVAMLAVLKAGAAYVPIDPSQPTQRLEALVRDAQVAAVLTTAKYADLFGAAKTAGATCLFVDVERSVVGRHSGAPLQSGATAADLAYVIYTSGSTGTPKGVMITHASLVNHMRWMQHAFPLRTDDSVLQKTPLTFDASVWEILAPLLSGARLVLAQPGGERDPAYLCRAVRANDVTVLQLVPTMLSLVVEEPSFERCRSLRNVFSGGEPLTPSLRARLFERCAAGLHNLYGPTETCIQVLTHTCDRDDVREHASIPIGRPIWNTRVHVVDSDLRSVDEGQTGELIVEGAALARGYWNRADLTEERFLSGLPERPGVRVYRTGDLVSRRMDGCIEFRGRIDDQIKLNGNRIELGEIEAALAAQEGVKSAVVAVEESHGACRLIAYVVTSRDYARVAVELRASLRACLPVYMIPSRIEPLDELPSLSNGKVDRRALPIICATDAVVEPQELGAKAVLSALWCNVLGTSVARANDDFFDLGGTSLDLIRFFAQAAEQLDIEIDVSMISEGATFESIARAIHRTLDMKGKGVA